MAYPYAPRISPAIGNGLGGLPKGNSPAPAAPPTLIPTIVDFAGPAGTTGSYDIPQNYSYFRVSVVGAGGGSAANLSSGGGGGGFSQSDIIPTRGRSVSIAYTCPGTTAAGAIGGSAAASFLDFILTATGGQPGINNSGSTTPGGVGSGGAINTNGGVGAVRNSGAGGGGGGAGGPFGDGSPGSMGQTNVGGGPGGGGVGAGSGGGGAGGQVVVWGGIGVAPAGVSGGAGGAWGGGGGGSASGSIASTGGYGGVRIELW